MDTDRIFLAEAARICGVDWRTFKEKLLNEHIKPIDFIPPRSFIFSKKETQKLAKRIIHPKGKGFAIEVRKR